MTDRDSYLTRLRRSLAWTIHPDTFEIHLALAQLRLEAARAARELERDGPTRDGHLPTRLRQARDELTDALRDHHRLDYTRGIRRD